MERDWRDFKSLKRGIEGARSAFEAACEFLIRKMNPTKNVQQIKVKHGDGGIDIYVGELGIEPIMVYQCKFFLEEFSEAQHAQIRKSFSTAINSQTFEVKNWVLCIPHVLTLDETQWWTKWKNTQIVNYNKDEQFISLINGNELINLMQVHGIYNKIFEIEESVLIKEIHEIATQFVRNFDPTKLGLPKIKWSKYVGKQKWKNTPLIIGSDVYVGSAGDLWNQSDDYDGVYCLDINDGSTKWFYRTGSDVNEVSYFDGMIAGGCDSGEVFCISSRTGMEKWRIKLSSGIVSKIYKYAGYSEERLIVVCYNGEVYFLNLINGKQIEKIELAGSIISNITFLQHTGDNVLYISTKEGVLYELTETFDRFEVTDSITIKYPDVHSDNGFSVAELYSRPIVEKGKIYLGFVRHTYYDYPAVVCLDQKTKKIQWYASDPNKLGTKFGNVRTNLLIDDNQVVFTHPYSNELVGLSIEDGEVIWVAQMGRNMFQQWSSPIQTAVSYYLSRYDGYLYKVDKKTRLRQWGIYLGQEEDAGVVFDSSQEVGNDNEHCAWDLFKGYSLLSTPSIIQNKIIVGSDEGVLYCIENI